MKSGIPPEWAPHRATWMAWPRSAIWGRRTNAVRAEIDRVARTICAYEPVRLLYDPDDCGALPQVAAIEQVAGHYRSEELTSELQSLMRISYAVFCLKK